jgi:hypothetical protein
MAVMGRAIGLDVHLDFCEVAIMEAGELRSAGRIETTPERLELFGGSLGPEDRVALEVTGNATLQWVDWYNHQRLHGSCNKLTTVEYEQTRARQTTQ